MKQKMSAPMVSILVALTSSVSLNVWAQAPTASTTTSQTKAISDALARAKSHAAKPGDFVDANSQTAPQAAAAPATLQLKKKKIGTVVRPMNGNLKGINTDPSTTKAGTVATSIPESNGFGPLKAGDYTFGVALKNTMTFGRKEELETIGGKNYLLKDELFVGATHASGWGLEASAAVVSQDFADKNQNVYKRGDASVILHHPDLYKSDTFSFSGKFRAYVPTTQGSRDSGFRQFRYYSVQGLELAHKFSLSQVIMPIWMSANATTATDSPFYVYECLELAHQTTKSIALSIGEQTQVETHYGTQTGTTVEIYPFVDIAITKNLLIEPKFYFPVYVDGSVGDAPAQVSMNQTQAELFVKLSI